MNLYIEGIGFGVIAAASIMLGAMGFTLQFGLTNVLNIGYGALMTFGAFALPPTRVGREHLGGGRSRGYLYEFADVTVVKTILTVYAPKGGGALRNGHDHLRSSPDPRKRPRRHHA